MFIDIRNYVITPMVKLIVRARDIFFEIPVILPKRIKVLSCLDASLQKSTHMMVFGL